MLNINNKIIYSTTNIYRNNWLILILKRNFKAKRNYKTKTDEQESQRKKLIQ